MCFRLGGGEDYGNPGGSMLSMVDDGYMDANVAANEQQVSKSSWVLLSLLLVVCLDSACIWGMLYSVRTS
jgi:hypothetical protein